MQRLMNDVMSFESDSSPLLAAEKLFSDLILYDLKPRISLKFIARIDLYICFMKEIK